MCWRGNGTNTGGGVRPAGHAIETCLADHGLVGISAGEGKKALVCGTLMPSLPKMALLPQKVALPALRRCFANGEGGVQAGLRVRCVAYTLDASNTQPATEPRAVATIPGLGTIVNNGPHCTPPYVWDMHGNCIHCPPGTYVYQGLCKKRVEPWTIKEDGAAANRPGLQQPDMAAGTSCYPPPPSGVPCIRCPPDMRLENGHCVKIGPQPLPPTQKE